MTTVIVPVSAIYWTDQFFMNESLRVRYSDGNTSSYSFSPYWEGEPIPCGPGAAVKESGNTWFYIENGVKVYFTVESEIG